MRINNPGRAALACWILVAGFLAFSLGYSGLELLSAFAFAHPRIAWLRTAFEVSHWACVILIPLGINVLAWANLAGNSIDARPRLGMMYSAVVAVVFFLGYMLADEYAVRTQYWELEVTVNIPLFLIAAFAILSTSGFGFAYSVQIAKYLNRPAFTIFSRIVSLVNFVPAMALVLNGIDYFLNKSHRVFFDVPNAVHLILQQIIIHGGSVTSLLLALWFLALAIALTRRLGPPSAVAGEQEPGALSMSQP